MEQITKIKEALQGKKTYFVVAIGLLYVAGVWLGFWEWDERVLAVLGLGSLAFLRAAVKGANKVPLLLVAAVAIAAGPGCATTNQAGRTLASVAITVDHAMEGWGAYVAAGQATAEEEGAVKGAYEKYQLAMKVASGAYQSAQVTKDLQPWERARVALEGSQEDLLALIESFGVKRR